MNAKKARTLRLLCQQHDASTRRRFYQIVKKLWYKLSHTEKAKPAYANLLQNAEIILAGKLQREMLTPQNA